MCGRVTVKTSADGLVEAFPFAQRRQGDGLDGLRPRFNGAPGLEYPLIVNEPDMPGSAFVMAHWGFVPRWMKEAKGGPKPVNAKSETVATNGMFRAAYRSRRALMPIDGYFEWQAVRGQRVKQPYAISMTDDKPFALAAIWEVWRNPETGAAVRTFCVLTCPANDLMARIHDRMPVIIDPVDYGHWLSIDTEDPSDLLKPYPSERLKMWPVSTRVNSPRNDTPDILDPFDPDPDLLD
ncbi:SOS response-associated peptidase [Roseibium salinum]|uniref:Abasic site processing protein n=1 Tax=Roseibium salinum TaxID=1604349 RepID=A0ABT3R2F6_9HYPH|nr:SOS response-associated peptidase [Roseibium sp. DSM 29163]MCX2723379.1 SOS response-associated peptidase [Roseibium sp. DSM 29163]